MIDLSTLVYRLLLRGLELGLIGAFFEGDLYQASHVSERKIVWMHEKETCVHDLRHLGCL